MAINIDVTQVGGLIGEGIFYGMLGFLLVKVFANTG